MPFKPGHPRYEGAGRKKGTPNKRTEALQQILESKGFHIIDEIYELLHSVDLQTKDKLWAMLELVQYVYPKRKAIEHSMDEFPNVVIAKVWDDENDDQAASEEEDAPSEENQ